MRTFLLQFTAESTSTSENVKKKEEKTATALSELWREAVGFNFEISGTQLHRDLAIVERLQLKCIYNSKGAVYISKNQSQEDHRR